jgi:hypothetical protein
MQRVSGVKDWKMESEEMKEKDSNPILGSWKRLAHNKYCDLILLCSVAAAFGMLLAVSTFG